MTTTKHEFMIDPVYPETRCLRCGAPTGHARHQHLGPVISSFRRLAVMLPICAVLYAAGVWLSGFWWPL